MKLLEEGMSSLLVDNLHLRDALSRVIVEMIKREWPQHWGSLLLELNQASQQGTVQAELVLLVLLRLVEDVVILQVSMHSFVYISPFQLLKVVINSEIKDFKHSIYIKYSKIELNLKIQ